MSQPRPRKPLETRTGLVISATEELFRVLSPLPQIARVCPVGFTHGELKVAPDQRAGLCWASANRDETIFDAPEDVRLDRKPNPHVAFGAGAHTCLGAPMARLIMRRLLWFLGNQVEEIRVIDAEARENPFGTPYLFQNLRVDLSPIGSK